MKAAIYDRYGPPEVAHVSEVEKPVPKDEEVLIAVRAASLNPYDTHLMKGRPYFIRFFFGWPRPKNTRLGRDVAGVVEAVGKSVTRFRPGDAVFGACAGSAAQYACAAESTLTAKPGNVPFEHAAAIPIAGLTALQGLRDSGKLRAGQKVLINGAAGGVGTFAVQIAKWLGAEVTGVCSTRNVEMVRSLGADRVIDYTREDFTKGAERYDVICDCVGNRPLLACRRIMKPEGIFVLIGAPPKVRVLLARMLGALLLSRFGKRKFAMCMAKANRDDLALLAGFLENGKIRAAIDTVYPLNDIARAVGVIVGRHAQGKVVIALGPNG